MNLIDQIREGLKEALKAKDGTRVSVLRLLLAGIKNREIDKREPLNEEEILAEVASSVKRRRESIEAFKNGGRQDLADKEEAELKILSGYLPPQLSGEEIKEILANVIEELSASGPKDLGRVMKSAMPKLAGRADGREVNQLARELLS